MKRSSLILPLTLSSYSRLIMRFTSAMRVWACSSCFVAAAVFLLPPISFCWLRSFTKRLSCLAAYSVTCRRLESTPAVKRSVRSIFSFQNGIGFYFCNAAKLFFCKVFKGYFPLPPLLESQKQRLFYAI